jgi:DnaK suppressor protein
MLNTPTFDISRRIFRRLRVQGNDLKRYPMATKKKAQQKTPRKPVKKSAPKAAKKPGKRPAPKMAAKKPAKKPRMQKAPAKKAPAKKVAPKPLPAPKAVAKKLPPPPPARKPVAASKPEIRQAKPLRPFRKDELAYFRAQLQTQLELIQGNLNALAGDNLKRSPIDATGDISSHSTHMADHGTDNFDRELALNLASSRQDSLYDVEDAIRRIDDGTYGACESCGQGIERPRLKALPFAKKCMACQNAAERGRTLYRPFSGTLPLQQLAAEDAAAEPPDSMG